MRLLHDIRIPGQEAWVWGSAIGRNGIAIGEPRRSQYDNPLRHAFLVSRGEPNPFNGGNWPHRQYWYPWNLSPATPLNPACGRLKTQSRNPRWDSSNTYRLEDQRFCPECTRLQPATAYARVLRAQDPWTLMPAHERGTTLDPVSGV